MSEGLRGSLNALLFRTGDQSRDFMVVLATNRPGGFPLPHAVAGNNNNCFASALSNLQNAPQATASSRQSDHVGAQ